MAKYAQFVPAFISSLAQFVEQWLTPPVTDPDFICTVQPDKRIFTIRDRLIYTVTPDRRIFKVRDKPCR